MTDAAKDCKNFDRATGTCTTGCAGTVVKKGSACPYADQQDCSCYKKSDGVTLKGTADSQNLNSTS